MPAERNSMAAPGRPSAGPWHASRVNITPVQLLLDSPSLIYRAFFALPRSIRDPSGQSVNAAHGYLDMVSRLLVDLRPSAVTHVFDNDWRPRWRVDAYPGYKAKRAEDPPELPGQFPIIRAVLDAAGLPVAEAAGTEADDVIGTLATAAGPRDRVAIVTGDRDLFQLVRDPVVRVLFPRRGTSDMVTMDEAGVLAKCGVPPSRYVDFAILRGDPSDGLPGVAGVGEKTAARLVSEYPSLDALVAAHDRLPPRVAAALAEAGDYLDAMRVVVPVATKLDVDSTGPAEPDPERLQDLAERHRLTGPIRRLLKAMHGAGLSTLEPPPAG
jgi:5'-3' exonuclease